MANKVLFFKATGLFAIGISGFTYGSWSWRGESDIHVVGSGLFMIAAAVFYLGAALLENHDE